MAVSQGISSLPPAPIVGQAFVTQYYNVLQQSPNMVYRFYQDCSKIARPGLDGEMETVTTMEGINSRIMSLDYSDFKPVIKSIDAQESHEGGVIVLVTGSLTFKGTGTRSFAQSFFLAPQEKGFFVLNDVFKYLDEEALPQKQSDVQSNGDDHLRQASITKTVSESGSESKASSTEQVEIVSREEPVSEIKVPAIIKHEEYQPKKASVEKDVVVEKAAPATKSGVPKPSQQPPQPSQETVPAQDAPKKSYASIVKVMMEKKDAPAPIIPIQRSITVKVVEKSLPNSAPQKQAVIDNGMNGSNGNLSSDSEGNGCSIYIRNLPLNATSPQVEEAFKKFGAIKPTGVQVRSKQQGGFCFGFVEFEEQVSVQNALEASPIIIGGRQAYVEEKRPGSGPNRGSRGGPMPGRGGFRADGGRGARGGGYFGGRGNGRSDSGNKAEVNSRASQVAQDVDSDILEGFQVKNGRSRRNNRMVPNNVPRVGSVVA